MNDRDPITEWENAIKTRMGSAAMVLILLAFVCCLIAPLFEPFIKSQLRHKYVLYDDYEDRATEEMKSIRVLLWIVAIIGWIFFIYCQCKYP